MGKGLTRRDVADAIEGDCKESRGIESGQKRGNNSSLREVSLYGLDVDRCVILRDHRPDERKKRNCSNE